MTIVPGMKLRFREEDRPRSFNEQSGELSAPRISVDIVVDDGYPRPMNKEVVSKGEEKIFKFHRSLIRERL